MKIQFENVNFQSRTGPNGFGLKLARELIHLGHEVVTSGHDVRLTFIQGSNTFRPNVLRLDGIYFNSEQDWISMNEPIRSSYNFADAVIVQSEFDRELTERYFGRRSNLHVIHNGTDLEAISRIAPAQIGSMIPREKIWLSASAWRPHKRLSDNIGLFLEISDSDHVMLVAGKDAEAHAGIFQSHPRVKFLGDLNWEQLISCMKASGHFVHLAWLDHCPNVVIDARACGCKIYCTSAGGTEEIAGLHAAILEEPDWDYSPVALYKPPAITRYDTLRKPKLPTDIDIRHVSKMYVDVLTGIKN